MGTLTESKIIKRSGLKNALLDDHRKMEALLLRVVACVDADDPHGALEEWPAFERCLLDHMEQEEIHLLPALAEMDADETRRLLGEHEQMRFELARLGLELGIHAAKKASFDALVSMLFVHSEGEEELLYVWAERSLPERVAAALVRRIRRH